MHQLRFFQLRLEPTGNGTQAMALRQRHSGNGVQACRWACRRASVQVHRCACVQVCNAVVDAWPRRSAGRLVLHAPVPPPRAARAPGRTVAQCTVTQCTVARCTAVHLLPPAHQKLLRTIAQPEAAQHPSAAAEQASSAAQHASAAAEHTTVSTHDSAVTFIAAAQLSSGGRRVQA